MNLCRLILKEIRFRKGGFLLGIIPVAVAVAVTVGTVTGLNVHRQRTEELVARQDDGTRRDMAQMRDDYRRYMKDMGHNSIILHKDQPVTEFLHWGRIGVAMPEEYVHRLADAPKASYNHLLPVLQKRTLWPEHGVEIILRGTSGQVPVQAKPRFWTADGYIDPIREDIPPGRIEIGHSLGSELNVEPGQSVILMGQEFIVHRVMTSQGNLEDIAVWCSLDDVQRWFDKPGQINAILALECMGDAPALGGIVNHVPTILPDTRVFQFSSLADARYGARNRAARASAAAIEAGHEHRSRIIREHKALASILLPVVLAASGLWLFGLFWGNVRQRREEIGILRALGVKQTTLTGMFMVKAILTGLIGAVSGWCLGLIAGVFLTGQGLSAGGLLGLDSVLLLGIAVLAGPLWCVLAGWLPARWAAGQDPARILADG